MKKLIVGDIAKHGVVGAKLVQYQINDTLKMLIKEANERIRAEQNNCTNVYIKAASFFAR